MSFLLPYLYLGLCGLSHADDTQLWTSGGIRYRPRKKVRIDLTQHIRMDQDISRIGSSISELGISWSRKSWFRLGSNYRYQKSSKTKIVLEPEHRVDLYTRFTREFDKIDVSYRLQFQEGYEPDEDHWKHGLRNRVGLEYRLPGPLKAGVSSELFSRVGEDEEAIRFTKIRYTVGFQYKVVKTNVIEGYYRLQDPFDDSDVVEHIIGFDYQYRIPRKKKRKNK
jgi:long-subunit fatty acid transport protein